MSRIRLALACLALLAASGGCASLGEPVRDADGCIPAMALYQPGVGPGRAGMVIHVPRRCPPPVTMSAETMAFVASLAEGHAAGQRAERGPPPPPVSAPVAIRQGLEDFCGWFFGDQPYSLEGLRQAAFDAGYGRGAPVQFFPTPEMLREMSFSAVGFSAELEDRRSEGHGVVAFVSFHHPTCQIQVFGHGAEAETVLTDLEAAGWRRVEGLVRGEDWTAQRYYGGAPGRPLTLVATRVVRPAEEEDGRPWLDMVINVVPGEDPRRGLLFEPAP